MSFISNLSWRYATKNFDPSKPVSADNIRAIQDAIRLAPTSFGLQPFHVTVVTNPELKAVLQGHAYGQTQITSCSHLFVFSARTDVLPRIDAVIDLVSGGDEAKKTESKGYGDMMRGSLSSKSPEEILGWASRQAYIALGFALAASAELEVDSCPMEGFDNAAFKADLGLADHLHPVVILPVGYRAETEVPRPKVRFGIDDLLTNGDSVSVLKS